MIMKYADVSRFPDGTIEIKYTNGYSFEGYGDNSDNPISGILTTPEGVKYNIPDFKGENINSVFNMINRGELSRYIIKKSEL